MRRDAWGEYYSIPGDGNCAFRCLSLAIWGDEEQHSVMRTVTVCHVASNWAYYEHLTEFSTAELYRDVMVQDGMWGGSAEVHAAGWRFNRSVAIVEDGEVRFYRTHPGDESPVILRRAGMHYDVYLGIPEGVNVFDCTADTLTVGPRPAQSPSCPSTSYDELSVSPRQPHKRRADEGCVADSATELAARSKVARTDHHRSRLKLESPEQRAVRLATRRQRQRIARMRARLEECRKRLAARRERAARLAARRERERAAREMDSPAQHVGRKPGSTEQRVARLAARRERVRAAREMESPAQRVARLAARRERERAARLAREMESPAQCAARLAERRERERAARGMESPAQRVGRRAESAEQRAARLAARRERERAAREMESPAQRVGRKPESAEQRASRRERRQKTRQVLHNAVLSQVLSNEQVVTVGQKAELGK